MTVLRSCVFWRLGRGSFAELAPFQQSSVLWGLPHVSHLGVLPALYLVCPLVFRTCCHLSLFNYLHSALKCPNLLQ